MINARNKLEHLLTSNIRPRHLSSVVEWSEQNVFLSERITEQAGKYSTTNYPYVKEILENFADPKIRNISLCWGSQTSKTTTIYVGVGYIVKNKPCPILMVYPNDTTVRSFANDRLIPFFKDSPVLAEHLPRTSDGKFNTDKINSHRIEFDRCSINLVGGGSRANVRSYPVSFLVLDEIDVIHEGSRREALDRIKGRRDYKIVQASTPLEETTGIWGEFLSGDQRKYKMPCPHCMNEISFEWKVGDKFCIRYDKEKGKSDDGYNLMAVLNTSFYYCQVCDKPINDRQKIKMLREGKWIAKNESVRHRSYHLNSLYSPTLTFGEIMVKWLQSHYTVEGIKNFVQGWLAEPWKDEILNVSEDRIKELSDGYNRGEIKGELRIISADVQRDHYYYIVRGFEKDGRSYLIDHGLVSAFEDLDEAFQTYKCAYGVIDTGYGDRAQETYENIFRRRRNWYGIKGWQKRTTPYSINLIDPFTGTNKQGRWKIKLIHLDVTIWQGELNQRRSGKINDWKIYDDPDIEYIKQLSSKWQYEHVNKRGERKVEWRTKSGAGDHYWDCETYCLAFSKLIGFGRVRSDIKVGDLQSASSGESQNNGKEKKRQRTKSLWR